MKKTAVLIISAICIFLVCCGKSSISCPYMELHENAETDFYSVWDSIDFQESTDRIPENINDENFIAYFASEDSLLSETKYIILNEEGVVTAYANTFRNGKVKTFSGRVRKGLLYKSLSCLYFKDIPSNATDEKAGSYAFIYYKENGNIYRCPVNNILNDYRVFFRQFARKKSGE